MPPVRQAAVSPPTPAPPARAPPRRAPSPTAALQARIGNEGVHQLIAGHAANTSAPAAGKAPAVAVPAGARGPVSVGPAPAGPAAAEPAAAAAAPQAKADAAPEEKDKAAPGKAGPAAQGEAVAKGPAAGAEGPEGGANAAAGAPAAVVLHMPEPPSKPSAATAKRIGGVKARAGAAATAKGALPSGEKQVADAQKSVTPPDAERAAAARAQLIAQVNAAPSPEIVALCERIREVIRNKRPPDEDALVKADPEKSASEAGGQLNSTVQSEAKKVEGNYGAMNSTPVAAQAPAAPPIPGQPAAAPTAPVNARAAVPDAVPAESVALDKDAEEARKKTQAAGMDKPAAQLVQSGPVAEAREAQGELDQAAKEDPAEVLAKQQDALAKADGDMAALQMQALAALNASREGGVKRASSQQKGMVGDEQSMRDQAGAEAKAAFDQAQAQVKGLLKDLAGNAMNKWEAAKTVLVSKFKQDLEIVRKRVDERHSGASGFVVGLWDAVTGLPDWATEAYDKAESEFADGVIKNLTTISAEVNSIIAACDLIIRNARERIAQIYKALPASLQAWAAGEQQKFDTRLDQLHNEVIAERDKFNKDLIERSSQAVDEVRAEIAELRRKAGGLVGRIVAAVQRFLDDPVKFIIEGLLELLGIPPAAFWAVVAKIKKVVKDIVDDPVGFANNLLKGIGQGFSQFFDNFGAHLLRGFLTWLLGDLKDVQIPKDLSLKSIVTFFLQIMGITWPNIRKILAKKIGEKNVALIEKVYSLVSLLIEKGPEGIFEMIKEKLDPQAIVDQVVQMAVEFMVTAIAKQVAARLLLLFNPAGAILQAIEAIYRVLKWVFENAARIFTLIETIVNGLADIVAGNVGGFAAAVEKGLAMVIPPVLGFIADYFSLGDLPKMVAKQIKSFREWILGLIEKAFEWIIEKGKALLAAVGIGKKEKDKGKEGVAGAEVGEEIEFEAAGEPHRLWITTDGDDATVMVASAPQTLSDFLTSKAVAEAASSNAKLGGLVKKAKDQLKTVNMTADDLVRELTAVSDAKDPAKKSQAKSNKTKTEERLLAETVHQILEAMAKKHEPFAGMHGIIKQVSKEKEQESHHVPAKAMGWGIAALHRDVAEKLSGDPWRQNSLAAKMASALRKRADADTKRANPPGDSLSAISVSHKTHKGDAGIHSTGSAELLARLAEDPSADAILLTKRQTANDIKAAAYVSVNPQVGGWRFFLAEVRRRLDDAGYRSDPKSPRDPRGAADLILDQAEVTFEEHDKVTQKFLRTEILDEVNRNIDAAPQYAFEAGAAVVSSAMSGTGEGSGDDARQRAMDDLRASFETTWMPFRKPVDV